MSMFREVLARDRSKEETSNNALVQETVSRLDDLGETVLERGAAVSEPRKSDNLVFALAGPHRDEVLTDLIYITARSRA